MNNLPHTDCTVSELVWHDAFRRWTLLPDPASDQEWGEWLQANPGKEPIISEAKTIIRSLHPAEPVLPPFTASLHIGEIMESIEEPVEARSRFRIRPYRLTAVAACVALFVAGFAIWYNRHTAEPVVKYREMVRKADTRLQEAVNQAVAPRLVTLPDGSRVTLVKDARISYSANFSDLSKREVYLFGTATFDVAKDPAKPFMVYTNGLITKVLGTRFTVHSLDSGKVTVDVISGIVSVYSYIDNRVNGEKDNKKLNALILTANQKANYSGNDKTLMAAIVENPVVLALPESRFNFYATPIDSVFAAIELAYGIDIVYDEGSLGRRTFTARLPTETMYEKLDIICRTLNARYEVIDGKIVIYTNE